MESAAPWRRAPGQSNPCTPNSPGVPCFTPPPPLSPSVWSPKNVPFQPSSIYTASPNAGGVHLVSPLAYPTQDPAGRNSPQYNSTGQGIPNESNGKVVPPPPPPPPPPLPPMLLQNPTGASWRNKEMQNGNSLDRAPMHSENLLQGRGSNMDGINQQYASLPRALHNTLSKDKKPFTYTPGGLDFSELRSPYMKQKIGNMKRHTSPPPSHTSTSTSNQFRSPNLAHCTPPPMPSASTASSQVNQMPVRLPFAGPQLLSKTPSPNTGNSLPWFYNSPAAMSPMQQQSPNRNQPNQPNQGRNIQDGVQRVGHDINNYGENLYENQCCSALTKLMPQSPSYCLSENTFPCDSQDGPRQYGVTALNEDPHRSNQIPPRAYHTLPKMAGDMNNYQPSEPHSYGQQDEMEGNDNSQGEIDPRYRGPKIPSRSFKMLQEMTGEENSNGFPGRPDSFHMNRLFRKPLPALSVVRGPKLPNRVTRVNVVPLNNQPLPNSQYSDEAPEYYQMPSVPASQQEVEAEPKKYMGGKIPSRSFRMLQAMTAGENEPLPNEVEEASIEHQAHYGRPSTGAHIPSRSFRILQAMTGEENTGNAQH